VAGVGGGRDDEWLSSYQGEPDLEVAVEVAEEEDVAGKKEKELVAEEQGGAQQDGVAGEEAEQGDDTPSLYATLGLPLTWALADGGEEDTAHSPPHDCAVSPRTVVARCLARCAFESL